MDAHTQLILLLGNPVSHSLSPKLHNAAFQKLGLNYCYLAAKVDANQIGDAVRGIRALNIRGANVTVPHKTAVIPFLDELSDAAKAIGAVNTIIHQDGKLVGDNTDAIGFLRPLWELKAELEAQNLAIFGAGGAARAVLYGLGTYFNPKKLQLIVRDVEKGERLASDFPQFPIEVISWQTANLAVQKAKLLVNTTPMGMYPKVDERLWATPTDFQANQIAYDLIYNPEMTVFLQDAARAGAKTIGGMQMFIGQAAAAFEAWTGEVFPNP